MPIVAKSSGGNREPVPAGSHIARCFRILEIGHKEKTWEGKTSQKYIVRIAFELPNLTKVFDETKGPQPLMIEIPRTLSLNRNARLRGELESWRGKPFTEEEANGFDITALLGVPCMISIIHTEEGYERVTAISPLPAGVECPPQVNPTQVLSYDNWNQAIFDGLPEFLRKDIEDTPEYKKMYGTPVKQEVLGTEAQPAAVEKKDDVVPF